MKNNKGFTLIELLAIVVILAVIIAIAAPNMTREIKRSEKENENILNQKIDNASHIYAAKYYADKIVSNETVDFKLNDLVNDGLISFKDNVCKEKLSGKIIIEDGINYDYSGIYHKECYTAPNAEKIDSVKPTTKPTKPSTTTTKNTTTNQSAGSVLSNGMPEYKNKTIAKSSSNEKTANLMPWVIGYETGKFIQGFAITKDYLYLSAASTTGSVWTNDLTDNKLKEISSNLYYRINRKTDKKESMINPYAGHAQSFDVATINGKDQLFFNAFPTFSLSMVVNGVTNRGAGYQGFAYNEFVSSAKETIPEKALALYKNPAKGKTPASVVDGKNINSLDNYIKAIQGVRGNDLISGNSNYMSNPELAVDEKNNEIAFCYGKYVYIFYLDKLQKNDKNAFIAGFDSKRDNGLQGMELYGNTLYMTLGGSQNIGSANVLGTENKKFTFNVNVFNIENTSNVKYNFIINDYSQFISNFNSNDTYWKVEPEGISIYEGTPYLLLMRTEVKNGRNSKRYVDIYTMDIK